MDNIENELKTILADADPGLKAAIEVLYERIKDKKPNEILPIVLSFKLPKGVKLDEEKKQKLTALLMRAM